MLVRIFKFKRNTDKDGFQWTAESEIERSGFLSWLHRCGQDSCGREGVRGSGPILRTDWFAGAAFGDAPARI